MDQKDPLVAVPEPFFLSISLDVLSTYLSPYANDFEKCVAAEQFLTRNLLLGNYRAAHSGLLYRGNYRFFPGRSWGVMIKAPEDSKAERLYGVLHLREIAPLIAPLNSLLRHLLFILGSRTIKMNLYYPELQASEPLEFNGARFSLPRIHRHYERSQQEAISSGGIESLVS